MENDCLTQLGDIILLFLYSELSRYWYVQVVAQCPYMVYRVSGNEHALVAFGTIAKQVYHIVETADVVVDNKKVFAISLRFQMVHLACKDMGERRTPDRIFLSGKCRSVRVCKNDIPCLAWGLTIALKAINISRFPWGAALTVIMDGIIVEID